MFRCTDFFGTHRSSHGRSSLHQQRYSREWWSSRYTEHMPELSSTAGSRWRTFTGVVLQFEAMQKYVIDVVLRMMMSNKWNVRSFWSSRMNRPYHQFDLSVVRLNTIDGSGGWTISAWFLIQWIGWGMRSSIVEYRVISTRFILMQSWYKWINKEQMGVMIDERQGPFVFISHHCDRANSFPLE